MPIERLLIGAGVAEDLSNLPIGVQDLIEEANQIMVMSPALPSRLEWLASDTDKTRKKAAERLHEVLNQLEPTDSEVQGAVGADDPMLAFDEAAVDFPPDHILIVMRADENSAWQEKGLVDQLIEKFAVPVTAFRVASS